MSPRPSGRSDGPGTAAAPTPPARPRDSQRARLYRAEEEVPPGRRLPTVADLQAYADEVAGAPWFVARFGERRFEVRPGHGHRRATASAEGILQMPRWARSEVVLLHEMAHPLAGFDVAPHGPEYAGLFLVLVRRAAGLATAQALEDAFARHRVRHVALAAPAPGAASPVPVAPPAQPARDQPPAGATGARRRRP